MSAEANLVRDKVVGLVGDVHGNADVLMRALVALIEASPGLRRVWQLGDAGLVWAGHPSEREKLGKVGLLLDLLGIEELGCVLGNHEGYTEIARITPGSDGRIWIGRRVFYFPHGYRMESESGLRVAVLGGAGSPDRAQRTPGRGWWPEEAPDDETLAAFVSGGPVDVLLAHDAVTSPALEASLPRGLFTPSGIAYASSVQARFQRTVSEVLTANGLVLSGHYHARISTTASLDRSLGGPVTVRSEVLAADAMPGSIALLNLQTLDVTDIPLLDSAEARQRLRDLQALVRGHLPERETASRLRVSGRELRLIRAGQLPVWSDLLERARLITPP